ncbi:uncharacterized protein LOC131633780 [Vicia villosa]|uniref:uncharacterized protein LOC131633780 n=1 Tax=Vicia villosa TaxID=3911 RepID=UPI00273CD5DD|nr:uncharacterized protein LOC131633780 [Vicia villosa]
MDKGRNYKKKNEVAAPSDGNSTMRLRCTFRLRFVQSGIGWKVVVKCGMHNHRLDKDLVGHDILGRLKYDERKFVNDMTKYNMAPRYIVSVLKDKYPENLTSITQIYRARVTYRLGKRGALTEMQMYRLPLLEIVGVTSIKLMFSVAFAFLEHEREENFAWALEKLKELFYSEELLPDVMYVKSERQEHVMDQRNNMMYSNTEDEFDVHLNHFESVCGDIPSFVKYMKETWLTPYKERFVAAWTNRVAHLGNTIRNRVESAHWRLKNMLTTSRGDLCASWYIMNIMLKLQLDNVYNSLEVDNKESNLLVRARRGLVVTLEKHMGYLVHFSSPVTRF